MKEQSNKNIFIRVVKSYLLPFKYQLLLAIFFMIITATCVSYRAYLIKPAIDKIFLNRDLRSLYFVPIKIILVAIVSTISIYAQGYIMSKVTNKINYTLRRNLFAKLINKDYNFFKKNSVSKINAFFNDIKGITDVLNIILNGVFLQFVTLLGLVGMMFYQNWQLSTIAFIVYPILILPLKKFSNRLNYLFYINKNKSLDLYSLMGETFDNISVVKSNNKEVDEIRRISDELNFICKNDISISRKFLITSPMIEMIGVIGFAGVIFYGGYNVIKGKNTAGDFFIFILALTSAYRPVKTFSNFNMQMQDAIMSCKRYFAVIDKVNVVEEGNLNIDELKGNLEFKNVDFAYPLNDFFSNIDFDVNKFENLDKQVLFDLNFKIENNKSYALVGHSGSGKSTIFNLILRFYDVIGGEILLDGINIKNFTFNSLRKHISLVSQDVKLFNDTIYNNILYAKKDATKEEIINAAKMANVDEFVQFLDNGYNSMIGPTGSMLSGGQKQRISIARAFLKQSQILLLDEATSALDPISESLIKESLKILMKDKTTIIIAHRLSTIINCDHIFVFEQGYLKEQGNHDELLRINNVYKNLYNKQFSVEKTN